MHLNLPITVIYVLTKQRGFSASGLSHCPFMFQSSTVAEYTCAIAKKWTSTNLM